MQKMKQASMDNQKASVGKGRRVILFPMPLQGHITPMLQLANILYNKGLSITIIHTHLNSPNTSNYPHFTFCSISDGLSKDEASTTDYVAFMRLLNVKCVVPFQECLEKLLSNVEEQPIACLISDAMLYFTQAVADSLKLPRIVLRTSNIASFLVFTAIPGLLREKGYYPIQGLHLQLLNLLIPKIEKNIYDSLIFASRSSIGSTSDRVSTTKVKDLPETKTTDDATRDQLLSLLASQTKASSGLIWNSCRKLEQDAITALQQEFPIPIFTIGPFHKYFPAYSSSLLSQDHSCISWLDKQAPKSVIYVSFGSIVAINETEFLEIAWGLANSGVPFLWVVRPGSVQGAEWLEALPKGYLEMVDGRGHIVKWAPQQEVLAHPATGGFWTHNGWNSTLESICEGVPMICHPNFGDQLVIARYVSYVWRVGLHLEKKLERRVIERAIRRLILEAEGLELRNRIIGLKEQVDVSLKGGSAYKSLESLIIYIQSF